MKVSALVFLLAVLAAVCAPWVAAPAAQAAQTGTAIATLNPVAGLVQRQSAQDDPADLTAWETVVRRVVVNEGDRIRTGSQGRAELVFFEGVLTTIGPNTLVVVSTLNLPDPGSDTLNVSLDVLLGDTFSVVDVALQSGDRFEIHTPGATAAVRGTRWWTRVEPNGESSFGSREGVFDVYRHEIARDGSIRLSEPTKITPNRGILTEASGDIIMLLEQPPGAAVVSAPPLRVAVVTAACGDGVCDMADDETDLCPWDCLDFITLPNCGDGTCDLSQNEDLVTCPADCGPHAGAACGNGTCDADESGLTCPADCPADRYFAPIVPNLCGDGTCGPTESALNCPADCTPNPQPMLIRPPGSTGPPPGAPPSETSPEAPPAAPSGDLADEPADPDACIVTGDNVNLRDGPGESFNTRGVLSAGEARRAIGQSGDGQWLVIEVDTWQYWIAGWVVNKTGNCDTLPFFTPQPETEAPEGDFPYVEPGTWGPCGSCGTCGYPVSECVVSPEGVCVWDPGACRYLPPEAQAASSPGGRLTVADTNLACTVDQSLTVLVTFHPEGTEGIASIGARSDNSTDILVTSTTQVNTIQFRVGLHCANAGFATINAGIVDSAGRQIETKFTVTSTNP